MQEGNHEIEIRLLGPLEVVTRDGPIDLGGTRRRTLLAILAVHRNSVVSVDRLIEETWHGSPPATSRDTLQAHLAHLRRALGSAVTIERRSAGYSLLVRDDVVDVSRAETMIDSGRRALADGDLRSAAHDLAAALALWTGTPFDGADDVPSVAAERSRLEVLRRDTVEDWAETEVLAGRSASVIAPLEHLLTEDPWRERAAGRLMLALYRSGRQVDALACYERLRTALADDLGLVPSPELRDLQSEILRHEPEMVQPSIDKTIRRILPFVGRDGELSVLADAMRRCRDGERVVAVVRGEPGVGKTRLVRELALLAPAQGVTVLSGRCDDEPVAPFAPFFEAIGGHVDRAGNSVIDTLPDQTRSELSPIVPQLAGASPPQPPAVASPGFERLRFFEAIVAFLRAASPALLVLDDVHDADPATLALLRHVLRSPGRMPLCIALTTRTREPGAAAVADAIAEAQAEDTPVVTVELGGLTGVAVGALVRAALPETPDAPASALAEELHRATDGNPFFIRELLRDREESVPGRPADGFGLPVSVREAVAARVGRLPASVRDALSVAAVIGEEFDLDVLAAVAEMPEPAALADVETAWHAGLVVETATTDRFRFAHALLRRFLLDEVSASRRVRLHHLIGTALERLRAADLDAHIGELARHFAEATKAADAGRAVEYARRAGSKAMDAFAYEEAARHFRRAVDGMSFIEDPDDPARCDLLLRLGDALNRAGDLGEAATVLTAAGRLAAKMLDAERLAEAAIQHGGTMTGPMSVDPERVALLEQALAMVDPSATALRARLMARLAEALEYIDTDRAWRISEEALGLARASNDDATLAAALHANVNMHVVDGTDRLTEATELAELARRIDDVDLLVRAEGWRLVRLLELGDGEGADRILDALLDRATRLRQPFYEWGATGFGAMRALLHGDFDDAEALAGHALEIGQRVHPVQALQNYTIQLLAIRWCQGRLEEVASLADGIDPGPATRAGWGAVRAWMAHQLGRPDEARRLLDALAADGFSEVTSGPFWLSATVMAAEACAACGEAEHASILYDAMQPVANEGLVVGRASLCMGSCARYLGMLAGRLGRSDEAVDHLERALAFDRGLGARPFVVFTLYEYARALRARGEPGDAERASAAAAEARESATDLGMTWIADRLAGLAVPA